MLYFLFLSVVLPYSFLYNTNSFFLTILFSVHYACPKDWGGFLTNSPQDEPVSRSNSTPGFQPTPPAGYNLQERSIASKRGNLTFDIDRAKKNWEYYQRQYSRQNHLCIKPFTPIGEVLVNKENSTPLYSISDPSPGFSTQCNPPGPGLWNPFRAFCW